MERGSGLTLILKGTTIQNPSSEETVMGQQMHRRKRDSGLTLDLSGGNRHTKSSNEETVVGLERISSRNGIQV